MITKMRNSCGLISVMRLKGNQRLETRLKIV